MNLLRIKMRESEAMCYLDAYESVQKLERESKDVREYLRNIRLLKTIDSQSLQVLKGMVDEEMIEEIMKITGKRAEDTLSGNSSAFLAPRRSNRGVGMREKIILTAKIIEKFDWVASNGVSSMKKNANLWDYHNEEVILELKHSVARIMDLDGRNLFTVSGRVGFREKIAHLAFGYKEVYR